MSESHIQEFARYAAEGSYICRSAKNGVVHHLPQVGDACKRHEVSVRIVSLRSCHKSKAVREGRPWTPKIIFDHVKAAQN